MNKKFFSMLGISKKAGKLLHGSLNVEKFIQNKSIKLVILAEDASTNTIQKFKKLCETYNINYIVYSGKKTLGNCIGKDEVAVIGITDNGLAKVLTNIAKEDKNNGGE